MLDEIKITSHLLSFLWKFKLLINSTINNFHTIINIFPSLAFECVANVLTPGIIIEKRLRKISEKHLHLQIFTTIFSKMRAINNNISCNKFSLDPLIFFQIIEGGKVCWRRDIEGKEIRLNNLGTLFEKFSLNISRN